ncbi:N-acetylglucosaminyltransferase, MurG [Candidatus Omnitrophus magneticus]|uniref:UDP-N-acetylglucosamine--N-acetylmuramyl-(pentapeptide) pyrophosphoryl-undecaprenol N-acetylglucosamine transferase n=1 Tax=Candidatus Omnitrophus magneticus TaxID=1609969 RepID=A0A0F0CWJ3_9BACT|nr:N-acetylglucosaminyltransferase, MurG [Candidatus Omnitrophus magneticus]
MKNKKHIRVFLAAGGSGGHIFPAIALSRELDNKGLDVNFISSKRQLDRTLLSAYKDKSFFLSINPMPYNFNPVKWVVFFCKIFWDIMFALFLIVRFRPNVFVGFGGYSTGAASLGAKLLGIPILIHEQNSETGRANKILSRVAKVIAVSFKDSIELIPKKSARVVYTGNPIRNIMSFNNKKEARSLLGLNSDKYTILIIGGSQGSTFLNRTALAMAKVLNETKQGEIQFIHLTGIKDYESVLESYAENNISAKVFPFLNNIEYAYSACDIAISRSGAAVIFELALYGKPMILVPYPSLKNSQRSNARYFMREGAAILREEKDLSGNILAEDILKIFNNKEISDKMAQSSLFLACPKAAMNLAEEVIKLV